MEFCFCNHALSKGFIKSAMLILFDIMSEERRIAGIPVKLIIFIVGVVMTVLGGYFIGRVISAIVGSINEALLISGIVLFAAGIIILALMITRWIRR